MRPSRLDPLFAPATVLPGIGPKIAPLIARAVGAEGEEALVRDLLFDLPSGLVDRRHRPPLYEMPPSGPVTVEGVVERIEKPRGADSPWRVVLSDGNATIQIVYFKAQPDWLKKLYPLGTRLVVSGDVEWFDMRPQIRHPDYVLPVERAEEMPTLEPIYRMTAGLSPKVLRRAIGASLERLPELPEWLSPDLLAKRGLARFHGGAQSGPSSEIGGRLRPLRSGVAAACLRRARRKPARARDRARQPEPRPWHGVESGRSAARRRSRAPSPSS